MDKPESVLPISFEVTRELERKALHLPGLLVPFFYQWLPRLTIIVLGTICLLYYISEYRRITGRGALPLIGYLSKKLTRSTHLDLAPIYLAFGLVTISVFLPLDAALAGALLVCICDGLAAVVGMKFGKKRILIFKKTYLGTATFFLSSFFVLLPLLGGVGAMTTAVVATVVEAISIEGIDNLLVPIIGGILANYFL